MKLIVANQAPMIQCPRRSKTRLPRGGAVTGVCPVIIDTCWAHAQAALNLGERMLLKHRRTRRVTRPVASNQSCT